MRVCLVPHHSHDIVMWSGYLLLANVSALSGTKPAIAAKKWEEGAHVISLQLLCTVCMPLPGVTSTDPQHLADAPSLQPFSSMSLAF